MALVVLVAAPSVNAQFSMSPLTSFSPNSDGWLAPAEGGITYLTTGDTQRGMAYGNGHLYLVNRNGGNSIVRLDALTGGDLLSPLSLTGISGGTFAINKIGVAGDGAIYVGNLTVNSSTSPYKIYQWADDAATPTTVFSGASLSGARIGDSTLGVTGTGSATRLVSGFGSSPVVVGNNGYTVIDPSAGTSSEVSFGATPPAAGDFRLGLTFGLAGQVWGNQGSSALRETSYSGATGTLLGTATGLTSVAERAMSYAIINGLPVLATISTGDSTVRVYDASNPLALELLGVGNNTSGVLAANGNGTGDVAWGSLTDTGDGRTSAILYALSSNQGIQAYTVVVPEPTAAALAGLGLCALIGMRRFRK